jgi:hypothetical protein
MKMNPSKRFFYIALAALAVLIVAFYAIREARGPFLPPVIDENFFTGVIVVLMGLFLWNRRIWSEGKRAEALEAERKAAAEGGAESRDGGSGDSAAKDDGAGS